MSIFDPKDGTRRPRPKKLIASGARKVAHYGILASKRALDKTPRLKTAMKRTIHTQLGIPLRQDLAYEDWVKEAFPDFIELAKLRDVDEGLRYRPLISLIVPVYNTKPAFLRDCLDSIIAQVYGNWELCIVDDASPSSAPRELIQEYADKEERIKYKFLETNRHIAGATNEAISMATGDFVGFVDHDDLLWPNALLDVVKVLNEQPDLDFIYSDEDKILECRHEHLGPFFKPDWNPDFLHAVNYITHFTVVRKTLLDGVGGPQKGYDGAQDWDLVLRLTSATKRIYHIPKVLYSWRIHDLSTSKGTASKPYVVEAQRRTICDDLARKGYARARVSQDPYHPEYWRVDYPVVGNPLISIIIPTKIHYSVIKRCIDSIYKVTTYPNFEIVLVDTGSTDRRVLNYYRDLARQHDNFTLLNWPEQPFSFSRTCNTGAEAARGELLVMLNSDTEVLTPNWLELMAGDAQRKEIGAVGCLLLFPDRYHIQHAGVGVGLGGVAANSFSMMTLDQGMSQTQHLMVNTKHDMSAVTAACLMIRKSLFQKVGGFSEEFRVTYNDVDLCLRLREKGYENIYTPHVRLIHHESINIGRPQEVAKRDTAEFRKAKELFVSRWPQYVAHDPNLNPNLRKDNAFYDL